VAVDQPDACADAGPPFVLTDGECESTSTPEIMCPD
jgi:hypothetical protein